MRVVFLVLALAAATLLPAAVAAQETPTLRIVNPGEGAMHGGSTLEFRVEVRGFRLVAPSLAAGNASDAGYISWTVDGRPAAAAWKDGHKTAETTFLATGLAPGAHVVRAELLRGDGKPLDPPVFATRNVTINPDAPLLAFRKVDVRDDEWVADVVVERRPLTILSQAAVRWWLDGVPVATTNETTHRFVRTPGLHTLRAEIIHEGKPLEPPVFDERVVGIPEVDWVDRPKEAVAPSLTEPARLNLSIDVDNAVREATSLRLLVDGVAKNARFTDDAVQFDLPLGTHVVAVELVDGGGASLRPAVGVATVVVVHPPPPEIEFRTPREMATVPPNFFATVEVRNYTLGEDAGRVVWYVDGIEIGNGTDSQRIEGLQRGVHELRAELVDADGRRVAEPAIRRVHVEPAPAAGADVSDSTKKGLPGPGAAAALASLGVALALLRRR